MLAAVIVAVGKLKTNKRNVPHRRGGGEFPPCPDQPEGRNRVRDDEPLGGEKGKTRHRGGVGQKTIETMKTCII